MKRLTKLAVSVAVRTWDAVSGLALAAAGREPTGPATVLYYHGIPANQRAAFAAQLDTILELARVVRSDTSEDLSSAARSVAITFDDGLLSVLEQAYPELQRRRMPFTVFVPSGSIGRNPAWMAGRTGVGPQEVLMNAEQLRFLARDELVCIGSHTVTHPDLTRQSPAEQRTELTESKRVLEDVLGKPVELFSFPHGRYTPECIRLAEEVGYKRVFTIRPCPAFRSPREFITGRVATNGWDWSLETRLKVLGAYRWMDWVAR